MAWIESHQKLKEEPGLYRLMSALSCKRIEAIGILHMFWWWCVDHAEDGDLRKFNDEELVRVVEWNGDGKAFIDAMVQAEFIEREPYFRIRNWWKFVEKFMKRRFEKKPEKWQAIEALYKATDRQPTGRRTPHTGPTKHTKPNIQNQDKDIAATETAPTPPSRVQPPKSQKKSKEPPNPFLQGVINHVCQTWEAKRGAKYVFTGQHAKLLLGIVKVHGGPVTKALWDIYLSSNDEYYRNCGWSINAFGGCLPKLLDGPWRSIKQKYEVKDSGFKSAADVLSQVNEGKEK